MLFPSVVEKWAEGRLLLRLEDLRCSSAREPAVTSSSDFPTGICDRAVARKRTLVNSLTQHGSLAEFVPVVQQSAAASIGQQLGDGPSVGCKQTVALLATTCASKLIVEARCVAGAFATPCRQHRGSFYRK